MEIFSKAEGSGNLISQGSDSTCDTYIEQHESKLLLTSNKVSKSYGGDSDEREIETFNVVPAFCHHEDKGRNNQVNENSPHNENNCARDLCLPLGSSKKTKQNNKKAF